MIDPVAAESEEFSVDLSNSTEGKQSKYVFANGKYPAVLTDVKQGTAASGNAKYVFTYLFTAGPGEGTTKDQHLSLSDKALWKLDKTLKALGVKGDGTSKVVKFKRSDVVGKAVVLDMKQNPQPSGKVFMDVEAVLTPGTDTAAAVANNGVNPTGASTGQISLPF